MRDLGWRILVMADTGAGTGDPVRVGPGEGWARPLDLVVESGGGTLDVGDAGALAPAALKAALPEAAGDLDTLLHSPGFRKVESAVRGLELLLDEVGDAVVVEVLATTRKTLVDDFRERVYEPEMKTLPEAPISLIVLDFDLSHRPGDLQTMAWMADMAAALQAPMVAGTDPAFFDLKQLTMLPKLQDLPQRLANPAHSGWQKFQKEEASRWVALTVNRYLQRVPYTEAEDGHEEEATPQQPGTMAWGRGVWPVAAAIARSAKMHGHPLDSSGAHGGVFDDMPVKDHPNPKAKGSTLSLASEINIDEVKSMELSRLGFTPVLGRLGTKAVVLPLTVNAHRIQPGRLTVSGTLSYQMMLGRTAQHLSEAMSVLPDGGVEEQCAWLKEQLTRYLGALAGEGSVTVEKLAAEDGPTMAEIHIEPKATLEDMEFRFYFQVPLASA